MVQGVAAFTDTYLPTVNGVSYTVRSWRDRWHARGGRMDVVFPRADGYDPVDGEHAVRSLPFPFYEGFRLGLPSVPRGLDGVDVVHAHTPFAVGLAGLRLARAGSVAFGASYHTTTAEYADYLAPTAALEGGLRRASAAWERWFFGRADAVVAPSEATAERVRDLGVDGVEVVPNGVDVDFFAPTDPGPFLAAHDLPTDRTLVGYTGRQGYEKNLDELVAAAADLDATVVLGGDGPAHDDLRAQAADAGGDVRFLGFLDREELPAFYSALDVFAFPSPVETQGLVALEAMACGTPVVAVEAGALADTVDDGETGVHYPPGDVEGLVAGIERALSSPALRENCLARRESMAVDRSVDRLARLYDRL